MTLSTQTHRPAARADVQATPRAASDVACEWAAIDERRVVIATPTRMWIRPVVSGDPFAEPMTEAGTLRTTRMLLDAAWCAGSTAPAGTQARQSLPRYVRQLIGSHLLTSATPRLLRQMGERFRRMHRPDLARFADRFAGLEDGDQAMAADDLRALGYEADALVRQSAPPATATALRDYFAALADGPEPIAGFGYAYAVERSSLSITAEDLWDFGRVLPPGIDAMKCRRHHSGVGGDVAHVKFFVHSVSRLPAADRSRIARATYEAMTFISSVPPDDEIDDAALAAAYAPYRNAASDAQLQPASR